jgi:hypothetical protein
MRAVIGKNLKITANYLNKLILALIKAKSKNKSKFINAYPLEVSNG